jgi:hypothetical protein
MSFYQLFGFLILAAYIWWLGSFAYELITNADGRKRFFSRPGRALFVFCAVLLFTMLLVGISIPAIGEISIGSIGSYKIRIWGVGLIGSFLWLALGGWRMATEPG